MTVDRGDLFADIKTQPSRRPLRRLRVLHVIRAGRGRAAKILSLLLRHTDRETFEAEVVASSLEVDSFPGDLRAFDVPVRVLDMNEAIDPAEDLPAVEEMMAVIRAGRYDVVHLHGRKAGYIGRTAARASAVRSIVYTPHGFHFLYTHTTHSRRFHTRIERTLGRFTGAIICASHYEAADAKALRVAHASKLHVVHDGVDLDTLPMHVDHIDVRRRFALNPATRLIVMTGRLDAPKDPGTVLRAVRHVIRAHPRTRVIFVGDGELIPYCRDLAGQLELEKQVTFAGYRYDAPEISRAASINVLSQAEGAPTLSLLEDMATGKVVIASDIPGFREVIEHGKTGVLFPPGDERILAGAMLKLIYDPALAARLGAAARERIRLSHPIAGWARRIESIYLKTLKASATRW